MKNFIFVLGFVGVLCLAFSGEKDTHQVIYQTIYQKRVVDEPKVPQRQINQLTYNNLIAENIIINHV
ncbi:MAG: hypothetical protein ACP5UF_07785 [Hydrogenobaculum sp.]